jgi:hypothetical protein
MELELENLIEATRSYALVVAFQRISGSEGLDTGEQVVQPWPILISIQQSSFHEALNRRWKSLCHPLGPILIQNFPTIQLFEAGDVSGFEILKVVVLSLEFGA